MAASAKQVLGDYQLLDQLGEGGMAEVFRAQYIGRGSGPAGVVVVKRIRSELSSQPEFPIFRDMFINEARLVRRLSHPNLARIFALLEAVDPQTGVLVPFIVGEFVQGRDLWTLMKVATAGFSGRGVPPMLAAFIVREVARGLGHAHAHTEDGTGRALPIIHRDVSPENIMIADDGAVKLIDFGVAKALGGFGPQTRTGIIKGKLAYMAPEQVAQRPVPATDVFGAGIVLYEMLTGRRLFGGPNEFAVVQRVLKARIPPPGTRLPVPAILDEVTMCALERDLSRRYRDGAALAMALTEAMTAPSLSGGDAETLVRWMVEIGAAVGQPIPEVIIEGSDLHVDVVAVINATEGQEVASEADALFASIDGPVDPSVHAAVTQAMRTLGPEFQALAAAAAAPAANDAKWDDGPTHLMPGMVSRVAAVASPRRSPPGISQETLRQPAFPASPALPPGPKASPSPVVGMGLLRGTAASGGLGGPSVLVSQSLGGMPVPASLLPASSSGPNGTQSQPSLPVHISGTVRRDVTLYSPPIAPPVPGWAKLLIALLTLTVLLLIGLLLRAPPR